MTARKIPISIPATAPPVANRGTLLHTRGRPSMVSVSGMPEMTFISSSLTPCSRNWSMASTAGSISANNASRVFISLMMGSFLLQLAYRLHDGFSNLAQTMRHLPLLNFPHRHQRDQTRCDHIDQDEEGKCSDAQKYLNPRFVQFPGEG